MIKVFDLYRRGRSNKVLALFTLIVILLLGDLGLIIGDQFFGEEKGVVFSYKLNQLILISNSLLLVLVFFGYLISVLARYSAVIKKLLINVSVSLLATAIFICLIELCFYLILHFNTEYEFYAYDTHDNTLFRSDDQLGYAANVNATAKYQRILQTPDSTGYIFDTIIRTDSVGNRLIDIPDMHKRDMYAMFFGCSFTFGLGVQDNQTIPYNFARADTSYCVYNFALGGYGTQSMLARLEYTNLRQVVKQDSGVCFYIYMNAHPARVIGEMSTYTSFGRNLPYYDYKDGKIYHYGSFSDDRWFVSGFYSLLSKSNVVKYFGINLPPKIAPHHYKLTCDIIHQSYLEYKKQFHNDNFYVVVYPLCPEILEYLKMYSDLKVIDLSQAFDTVDKRNCFIPYDGHPTALAHKIVATHLMEQVHALSAQY